MFTKSVLEVRRQVNISSKNVLESSIVCTSQSLILPLLDNQSVHRVHKGLEANLSNECRTKVIRDVLNVLVHLGFEPYLHVFDIPGLFALSGIVHGIVDRLQELLVVAKEDVQSPCPLGLMHARPRQPVI